ADLPDRVGAAHAVPDFVEIRAGDFSGCNPAAGEATAERESLFMRPDHHLERVACAHGRFVERLERAKSGERSEIAVEVAAVRHGAEVGAEEDRREAGLVPGPAREDVAGGVDARFEAGLPNQAHHVAAALDVRVRVGDATDAAGERTAGRTAELAQPLQALA